MFFPNAAQLAVRDPELFRAEELRDSAERVYRVRQAIANYPCDAFGYDDASGRAVYAERAAFDRLQERERDILRVMASDGYWHRTAAAHAESVARLTKAVIDAVYRSKPARRSRAAI